MGTGLILFLSGKSARLAGEWLFGGTLVVSLIWGGWIFCSSRLGPASNLDFQKESALMALIHEKIGPNRVFLGDHIPFPVESAGQTFITDSAANISTVFHLKNAGGCNPLSLEARGELYGTTFPTFLRLMDIQGFATGNEKGSVPGFKRYQWGSVKFYESIEEKKTLYAPKQWEVIADPKKRLEAMESAGFNPYLKSFLSKPPEGIQSTTPSSGGGLTGYSIVEDGIDSQVWEVRLKAASLLVFSETNFPGWRAFVDGIPTPIYTANHLFRGIFVGTGVHKVVFKFQPTCILLSFFIFLLWVESIFVFALNFKKTTNQAKGL
jgi:hypothetical protein